MRISSEMNNKRSLLPIHVLLILMFAYHSFSNDTDMEEVCYWEDFEAECPKGEVVVMQHAHYGRMHMGRCVEENLAPGYEGCYRDVLNLAHRKCSGKSRCSLPIPDPDFEATKPCSELQNYLETKYGCIAVESGEASSCRKCDYIKVSSRKGYLASSITYDSGCGSADCPWLIEGGRGQTIHIKLLDFGVNSESSFDPSTTCKVYTVFKERFDAIGSTSRDTGNTVTVCGGKQRHQDILETNGNSVQVRILGKSNSEEQTHFLIEYEVVGCADPDQSGVKLVRRTDEKTTVKCPNSDLSWSLTCNKTSGVWTGANHKCHESYSDENLPDAVNVDIGISISLIVAIAVVIGALILTIGLVCFKRRALENSNHAREVVIPPPPPPPPPVRTTEPVYDVYGGQHYDGRAYNCQSTLKPAKVTVYSDNVNNEYTHIWERPLPQPVSHGIRGNQSV